MLEDERESPPRQLTPTKQSLRQVAEIHTFLCCPLKTCLCYFLFMTPPLGFCTTLTKKPATTCSWHCDAKKLHRAENLCHSWGEGFKTDWGRGGGNLWGQFISLPFISPSSLVFLTVLPTPWSNSISTICSLNQICLLTYIQHFSSNLAMQPYHSYLRFEI